MEPNQALYKIRKIIGKEFSDRKIKESYRICKKYGITTSYYWLFGHPCEKLSDMKKTINLSLEVGDYDSFSPTLLYPGTGLFDIAYSERKITKDTLNHALLGNKIGCIYVPDCLTGTQIISTTITANIRFYLRPKQAINLLRLINFYNLKIYFRFLTRGIQFSVNPYKNIVESTPDVLTRK